jgi:hypothetical protein
LGELLFKEFAVACFVINEQAGGIAPDQFESTAGQKRSALDSSRNFMDAVNLRLFANDLIFVG